MKIDGETMTLSIQELIYYKMMNFTKPALLEVLAFVDSVDERLEKRREDRRIKRDSKRRKVLEEVCNREVINELKQLLDSRSLHDEKPMENCINRTT